MSKILISPFHILLLFCIIMIISCSKKESQFIEYKDNYSSEKGGLLVTLWWENRVI